MRFISCLLPMSLTIIFVLSGCSGNEAEKNLRTASETRADDPFEMTAPVQGDPGSPDSGGQVDEEPSHDPRMCGTSDLRCPEGQFCCSLRPHDEPRQYACYPMNYACSKNQTDKGIYFGEEIMEDNPRPIRVNDCPFPDKQFPCYRYNEQYYAEICGPSYTPPTNLPPAGNPGKLCCNRGQEQCHTWKNKSGYICDSRNGCGSTPCGHYVGSPPNVSCKKLEYYEIDSGVLHPWEPVR